MDPSQYNHMQGMIAGMMGLFVLFGLAVMAFFVFLFWRIFDKAGLAGPLALLLLLWPIGLIIVACILAFSDWRVVPAAQAYPGLPPYPPQSYPPQSYPPQGYSPQSSSPQGYSPQSSSQPTQDSPPPPPPQEYPPPQPPSSPRRRSEPCGSPIPCRKLLTWALAHDRHCCFDNPAA